MVSSCVSQHGLTGSVCLPTLAAAPLLCTQCKIGHKRHALEMKSCGTVTAGKASTKRRHSLMALPLLAWPSCAKQHVVLMGLS